jgi:hypothetical protein
MNYLHLQRSPTKQPASILYRTTRRHFPDIHTIKILRARYPSLTAFLSLTLVILRKQTLLHGPLTEGPGGNRKPGTDHENGEGRNKRGNEMRDKRKKQERGNVRAQSHGAREKRVKTVFIMKYRNVFFEKDK